jgi:hypothetical protein
MVNQTSNSTSWQVQSKWRMATNEALKIQQNANWDTILENQNSQ